jgi:tripartite-type tricarboxylate transporter receptor subunit TctC
MNRQRTLLCLSVIPSTVLRIVPISGTCRRRCTFFLCIAVCAAVFAPAAKAQQTFPTKPVRLMVSAAAGSGLDSTTRMVATKLSDHWRQPVVIDNRPGIIANSTVAKAAPDGHNLLFVSASIAVRAVMFSKLPYDTLRDFAGVTELGTGNSVLLAAPAIGVKTVKDLVDYAQTRPGKVFFASPVAGGMDHMNAERFRIAAGIKAQHVSYKGSGESAIEVAAGRAQFTVVSMAVAMPLVRDGKVVPLVQRHPVLPGVPLIADVLPEWTLVGASSVLAPAGTPLALRQQIGKDIARVLNLPDIKERLEAVAFHVETTTPEEQERRLRATIAAFAKVMKEIGLKPN